MIAPTYITHGRKYHVDPACPRMIHGEELHDCEGDSDWGYGGFTAGSYRREDPSPEFAAMRGKLPCLGCVPPEQRVFPPLYGQTFGHEPFLYDGVPICRRCFIEHRSFREAVAWPCTSAVVLGLVAREQATS
ncbi:hypothetical protein [Streptomyces lavendofoliae]|uniref:Uncharacterized protein n=1 Tax=Streptomyces lavendofoliae TaxID=67314 RepID=A0A918I1K6_9ACTN|nr:hypothetical protein [Streptomyces lavendofoliae]GGU52265.1 hypothetical protein GCM10010274_46470 [Streptomyces lavendofoliae]